MICSFSLKGNYNKIDNKWCDPYHDTGKTSLATAKEECSNDNSCTGVYDSKCDGGKYYICRTNQYIDSTVNSCIFAKIGMI